MINERLNPRVPALIRIKAIRRALKGSIEERDENRREVRPSCSTRGLVNRNPITIDIGIHIPIAYEEVERREEKGVVIGEMIKECGAFNGIRMDVEVG